jgi:hypothetical protein
MARWTFCTQICLTGVSSSIHTQSLTDNAVKTIALQFNNISQNSFKKIPTDTPYHISKIKFRPKGITVSLPLGIKRSNQCKTVLGVNQKEHLSKGSVGTVAEHKSQPAGLTPLPCEDCLFNFGHGPERTIVGAQWPTGGLKPSPMARWTFCTQICLTGVSYCIQHSEPY